MYRQIKQTMRHSRSDILSDLIGGGALVVMLLGGLYLPGLM